MAHGQAGNDSVLGRLVGDPLRFATEVWGREPLLRRGAGAFDDLFSVDALDAFLASGVRRPVVRMVCGGAVLPAHEYCTTTTLGGEAISSVVDARKVARRFAEGATLVAQSLHQQCPPIARFTDRLVAELGHRVQVNAYLTPAEATGLRPHRDRHDVIVVQLEGAKRWVVEGLGEFTMETGDVLYLPTGREHSASTSGERSLHLTIGILRTTYRMALDHALQSLDALDAPLPLAIDTGPHSLEAGLAHMIDGVVAHLRSACLADLADDERRRQPSPAGRRGLLRSVVDLPGVDAQTRLRWATDTPRFEPLDDDGSDVPRVRLVLGHQVMRVPTAACAAILATAGARCGLRVHELPGLDPPGRLVLARRLIREGACVIDDERPHR